MKKLTKTLSLVLVVAMVLGLCVFGAGATFTDNSKITKDYSEAITIATDLGVVKGNANGAFNPAGTLTRAEAAVILAKMTVGASMDSMVYTKQTFKDVPTSFWGYKYIEYAAAAGLTSGTSATTFSPNATLTGYQWALMVLKAVGYKNEAHGITGANWAINTAKLYYAVGLSSVTISNNGISREEATQIAYDALFFGTVPSTNATTTTINGITVTTGGTEGTLNTSATLAKAVFGVTRDSVAGVDSFGRPATVYTTTTKAQATAYGWNTVAYSTAAKKVAKAAVLTYTTAVKPTALKLAATNAGYTFAESVDVWTNGVKATYNASSTPTVANFLASTTAVGGNGCLIELYANSSKAINTIVAVNTWLAPVASSTVDSAATTAIDERSLTLTVNGHAVTAAPTVPGFDAVYSAYTAAAAGVTVLALVVPTNDGTADGVAMSLAVPQSKTVTPNAYNAVSFTADGTTYMYSGELYGNKITGFNPVVIYLDAYGYVIGTTAVASIPNYAVFQTSTTVSNWPAADTISAQVVKADGTVEVMKNVKDVTDLVAGDIVTYAAGTGADTGKVILTEVASYAAGTIAVTKGAVAYDTVNKGNSKTIFIVKTVTDGVVAYNTYTGVGNVPSIASCAGSTVYDAASDGYMDIVYINTAVLTTATTSDTVAYVDASSALTAYDSVKGTYTIYNAVVNGTVTTVETTQDLIVADGIYGKFTKNAKGLISTATPLSGTGIALVTSPVTSTTKAANGIVTLGTAELTYTDATQVYYVTATGITKAAGVSAIATDANDTVVYYTTGGILTAAYITVA